MQDRSINYEREYLSFNSQHAVVNTETDENNEEEFMVDENDLILKILSLGYFEEK